jgi:hypothetical protein
MSNRAYAGSYLCQNLIMSRFFKPKPTRADLGSTRSRTATVLGQRIRLGDGAKRGSDLNILHFRLLECETRRAEEELSSAGPSIKG